MLREFVMSLVWFAAGFVIVAAVVLALHGVFL